MGRFSGVLVAAAAAHALAEDVLVPPLQNRRGVLGARRIHRDDVGQHLVLDVDQTQGVVQDLLRLRSHAGHVLPGVVHYGAFLALGVEHALQRLGTRQVDAHHARVRMRRAQQLGEDHRLRMHVVRVLRAAGDLQHAVQAHVVLADDVEFRVRAPGIGRAVGDLDVDRLLFAFETEA